MCAAFDVDGLRADLVTARAAIAHAAWEGRDEVTAEDVRAAARLALPHRRRRQPFDAPQLDEDELDRALAGAGEDPDDDPGPGDDGPGGGEPGAGHETDAGRPTRRRRRESAGPRRGPPQEPGRAGARPAAAGQRGGQAARRPRAGVPGQAARGPRHRRGRGGPPVPGPHGLRSRHRGAASHGTGSPGCTCPPRSPRPRRTRWPGAGSRATGCCCAPVTCARPVTRAGSPTWCCSWWTPAARWRPGPGWARSRARCCPCCSTPTSAGTRSAWSRSGAAAAELALPPTFSVEAAAARLAAAADRRAHPARGRPAAGRTNCCAPSGCAIRAAAPCWCWSPTGVPPAARTRWPARTGRRACWRRRACTAWSWTASPARSGWAWPPPWPSPSAASLLRLEELAAGPLGRSVRVLKEVA